MTISFWTYISAAGFCVIAGIVTAALLFRHARREDFEPGMFRGFGWTAVCWSIGWLAASAFALYPYKAEYHAWHVHAGTVAHISSRLLATGSGDNTGTSQKFVVQFTGSQQQYGIDDTRAALVKPGDHLRLTCIRTHQWGAGVDGYDCRWDQ
jgi:hypothetical protein